MQLGHILSVSLSVCVVVVTGEWKCERKGHARVKKEWKITLKVLKMSGKLMALGCWFPPKFPNSGTLREGERRGDRYAPPRFIM